MVGWMDEGLQHSWFCGEVLAGPTEESVVYAGVPFTGDVYTLY